MATNETYSAGGVLLERWDDATRVYTDFRPDPDESRPYTPEEDAAAEDRATAETEAGNAAEIDSDLDAAIAELQVIIDTDNAVINGNPAGEIKDIARVLKKTIRKLNERYEDTE